MLGFPKRTPRPQSKDDAVGRLKMVLSADRIDGAGKMLEMMKNDILEVMRKYVVIDEESIEIQVLPQGTSGESTESKLKANIPLRNVKRQR